MNAAEEWREEERAEKIAEALTELGLDASAEDTGGGIVCIVVPRADGGAISWGTADVTWAAAIIDQHGQQVSSISTKWPTESEEVAATAQALLGPSLEHGAVLSNA